MVLKLLDKETLTKADLTDIFASVDKRPFRVISSARRAPTDRKPVLTATELSLLGPSDVAELANGNGNDGSKANGSKANGTKSTARKTAARPRTAKATTAQRTSQPREPKRTEGRGEAPGTST
jgi:cell division protease FtsH